MLDAITATRDTKDKKLNVVQDFPLILLKYHLVKMISKLKRPLAVCFPFYSLQHSMCLCLGRM